MLLIKVLFQIICTSFLQTASFNISPGAPVPHDKVLDELLSDTYFKNYTEPNTISIFDYLFGDNFTDLENLQVSEHLDISVLSPENIQKIAQEAQRKYELEKRSYNESSKVDSRRIFIHDGDYELKEKSMNWMMQSIYGTRRRLEVTRPYRKKFQNDLSYNMGILYGILSELMKKVDSVYTAMRRIRMTMKFIWYIFTYQRLLTFNVDVSYIVERMFEIQKKWNAVIGRKEVGDSEEEQGSAEIGNMTLESSDLGVQIESWINHEAGQGLQTAPIGPKPNEEGSMGMPEPEGQLPDRGFPQEGPNGPPPRGAPPDWGEPPMQGIIPPEERYPHGGGGPPPPMAGPN